MTSKRCWLPPSVKATAILRGIRRCGVMCLTGASLSWCMRRLTRIRFGSSRLMRYRNRRQSAKRNGSVMAKKNLKRVYRSGKLSTEQAARDETIRRKVQAEFPPLEAASMAPVLSDPLKAAIAQCPKTVRQLAPEAGVSEIVLTQ